MSGVGEFEIASLPLGAEYGYGQTNDGVGMSEQTTPKSEICRAIRVMAIESRQ